MFRFRFPGICTVCRIHQLSIHRYNDEGENTLAWPRQYIFMDGRVTELALETFGFPQSAEDLDLIAEVYYSFQ